MKRICLILCAAMLVAFASLAFSADAVLPFPDVKETDWYYSSVQTVYEENIMVGDNYGNFNPKDSITRASFVVILAKLSGEDVTGYGDTLEFTDTVKDTWYSDYLGWAVDKGLANGRGNGKFAPSEPVTRQEIAVFLNGFIEKYEMTLPENAAIDSFNDTAPFAAWAAEAIDNMRLYGIISGNSEGYFNPTNDASRAEVSMMIFKYLEAIKDPMHYKLDNITKIVECNRGMVIVELEMYERLTDNSHKSSLSEQLLPQMELDTGKYEIVADKEGLSDVREHIACGILAGEPENDKSYSGSLKICIRNKETGECTDAKSVRFSFIRKVTDPIEPEAFDSGIDPEIYEVMLERSFAYSGNIARFAKVFEKAANGEDITVGYIGGSVTQGAVSGHSRQYSWARLSHQWLTKQFPDAEIGYVNAGIGGTPSDYGNFRGQPHLLSHDPDIVFIEFSVNNNSHYEVHRESYEALLRAALSDEKVPAVALVISALATDHAVEQAMDFAEYYGVPVINTDEGVFYGIDAGEYSIGEYAPDTIHPYEWGHRIMGDMVIRFYEKMMELADLASDDNKVPLAIPEAPLSGCYFGDLIYCDGGSFTPDTLDGWTVTDVVDNGDLLDKHANLYRGKKAWKGEAGDVMSFTLDAKSVTLLVDSGSITVTVNSETTTYDDLTQFCTIVANETSSEITFEIRAESDTLIYGFAYN